jgi:hypothetical protein
MIKWLVTPFSYCFVDLFLLYNFVSFPFFFFWNDELLILLQTPAERVKAKMKLQLSETGDHSFSSYELGWCLSVLKATSLNVACLY